jgi:hypothetical protein
MLRTTTELILQFKYYSMTDIVVQRTFKPWIHPDWLFRLSPLAKQHAKYLAILHDMTNSVIMTKKSEYLKRINNSTTEERDDTGKAPRHKHTMTLATEHYF